jgi:hypothetical protein
MNSETSGTPQGEAAQTVIPGAEPASVQKNTVYYSQIGFSPSVERPERLIFVCEPTAPEVPESLADLRKDYNTTARVVNNLFDTDSDTRRKFFIQLHEAADIVFLRPGLRIADGKSNLEEVRQSIVDKAQKIRDGLFWTYSQLLVLFGIIPLLIGAAIFKTNGLSYFPAPTPPAVGGAITYDPNFCWTLAIFLIPAGATICIWADFAFGMLTSMSYDKLLVLSPSRWRPIQRLLVTVVFC